MLSFEQLRDHIDEITWGKPVTPALHQQIEDAIIDAGWDPEAFFVELGRRVWR